MVARILIWLLKLGLVCLVLAYEQAISIPYLTLIVVTILVQNQSPFGRQALLLTTGVIVATVYQLPLGWGMALVWGVAYGWKLTDHLLKQDSLRLFLVSFGGALSVGIVTQVLWTNGSILFLLFNIVVSLFMMRLTVVAPDKNFRDTL